MSKWQIYVRSLSGGQQWRHTCQIVASIGRPTAHQCRKQTERDLAAGKIDAESYATRISAIDDIEAAFVSGVKLTAYCEDERLWQHVSGGRMKKDFHHG